MSLNIKNERVHELAREAARRTGKSQTSVIEEALRTYLEALEREQSEDKRWAAVEELLVDLRRRLAGADLSTDFLYDENGMPA